MEYDGSTEPIHTRTHRPSSEGLVTTIVSAIADAAGTEPAALDRPLYEAVDTDALAKLFHDLNGSVDGYVAFNYDQFRVFIHSDGTVQVYDRG